MENICETAIFYPILAFYIIGFLASVIVLIVSLITLWHLTIGAFIGDWMYRAYRKKAISESKNKKPKLQTQELG